MQSSTRASDTDHLGTLLARLTGDEKHGPSAYSTLDVLWVLYDQVLRVTPATVDSPDRDRFLLSKGHGPAAYYAVLAAKGFLPANTSADTLAGTWNDTWNDTLDDMGSWTSPLGHHPDRLRIPGVEISSGSLGHGLPIAVGVALGLRARGLTTPRVYVLLGDAELDEGSNHEAISYAGAVGLESITAIVIDNQSATHGWPGGIDTRFTANGWSSATVDGRDHAEIARGLTTHHSGQPHVMIARTERKG